MAPTSLKVSSCEHWYFDSVCSRHMTGERNYLKNIKSYLNNYVTFDDGAKGKIIGKRKLDYTGLPCLYVVLIVDGLATNLIRISQLCNQKLYVKFDSMECTITYQQYHISTCGHLLRRVGLKHIIFLQVLRKRINKVLRKKYMYREK